MLTVQENQLLTQVGPGTPMGELQRRYSHPIAALDELAERWAKPVRLLGENLMLLKNRGGELGLFAVEPPHQRGYAVEEIGGAIFAYIGPAPRPLLPRMEGFADADRAIRMFGTSLVPCNWLQIMENSVDPIHAEWLHGHLAEFVAEQNGSKFSHSRRHLKIDFAEFEYGIYKRRLLAGAGEDSDDWRVGHPVIFPNTLAVGSGGGSLWTMYAYQIRVPVDDETTLHVWYDAFVPPPELEVPPHLTARVPAYDVPFRDENGAFILDLVDGQDIMAWVTQGRVAERDLEKLGSTDRGITMYRRMLQRELRKLEAGEDPMCVIRDPAKARLSFPLERDKVHFRDGFTSYVERVHNRYCDLTWELEKVFRTRYGEPVPA